MAKVIFGYQPISRPSDMPPCPCGNNHVALEQPGDDPLDCRINCWCGRHVRVTFDTLDERTAFVVEALGPDAAAGVAAAHEAVRKAELALPASESDG